MFFGWCRHFILPGVKNHGSKPLDYS